MKTASEPRWGWISAFLLVVLVATALGITYREVFIGEHARLSGRYDVYREVGPLCYYLDHCLHRGELPLWNPLTFCGMPYIANPVTGALYPLNLLRSAISFDPTPLKTQIGLVVLVALHLLVAGIGILLLARTYGLSRAGALAAALVFLLSAIWVRRICEYHFIFMVAWLPWLLLLARGAVNAPNVCRKAQYGILVGLIFGLSMLTGALNIAPYMAVCVVGYVCLQRVLRPDQTAARVSIRRIPGALVGDALFVALFLGFAALAGMALLLPGSELAGMSSRVKDSDFTLAVPHYAKTWQQLFHDLIRYPGTRWEVEDIRGAGIAALLLALVGLTHRHRRAVLLNLGLFLVLFDLSMGPPAPLSRFFYALSPIQMIASTRAFDFALLPAAFLAGFGLDAVTGPWRGQSASDATGAGRPWRAFCLRMLVMVRDAAVLVVGAFLLYSLKPLLGGEYIGLGGDGAILRTLALAVPGVALCVMVMAGWLDFPRFWRVALLLAVVGETLVWNAEYVPAMLYAQEYQRYGNRNFSTEFWADNARGVDDFQNRHLYELRGVMHGYEPVYIERVRETLSGDARGSRYQRSVKDYEITQQNHRGNLFLKRQFWLARQVVRAPLIGKHSLFPAATTVFLPEAEDVPVPEVRVEELSRSSISTDDAERHGERTDLLDAAARERLDDRLRPGRVERTFELPEIDTGGRHSALVIVLRSPRAVAVQPRFRDADVNRRQDGKFATLKSWGEAWRTVEIPLPQFERVRGTVTFRAADGQAPIEVAELYLLSDMQDEGERIHVLARSANRVLVEVTDLPGHRILTNLDAWYPGWRAYIDGKAAPILRANDAFKAVIVPPGTHRVAFVYHSWRVYAGIATTLFAVVVGLVAVAWLGRAARRRREEAASARDAEGVIA